MYIVQPLLPSQKCGLWIRSVVFGGRLPAWLVVSHAHTVPVPLHLQTPDQACKGRWLTTQLKTFHVSWLSAVLVGRYFAIACLLNWNKIKLSSWTQRSVSLSFFPVRSSSQKCCSLRAGEYVRYMQLVAAEAPRLPFYLYDIDFVTAIPCMLACLISVLPVRCNYLYGSSVWVVLVFFLN